MATATLANLSTTLADFGKRHLSPAAGWIGVDLGSASFKAAQIERTRTGWRFAARWKAYDEAGGGEHPAPLAESRLAALRAAKSLFRGRNTAVGLSTSFAPLRALQLPEGSPEELSLMMRDEVADDSGNDVLEIDAWPAPGCRPPEGQTRWMVTAMRRSEVDRLTDAAMRAGFHPQVIDVAPTALARAVRLSDPSEDRPVAVLELGAHSALLAVVQRGAPGYCRILRDCGTAAFIEPLTAKLDVSVAEAWYILRSTGPASPAESASAQSSLQQLLMPAIDNLVDEVARTIGFLRQEYAEAVPAKLKVFGGGSQIANISPWLERAAELPTHVWNLSGRDADGTVDDGVFGIAAGLSALAWELE